MSFDNTVFSGSVELPLREMIHKTTAIAKGRGKAIVLREHAEEKACVTDVQKHFIYLAAEATYEEAQPAPRVHINKSFDSVSHDERFCFRIKGFFYVNQSRRLIKVAYLHTLKINLHWKPKTSSPKKTVTMA